MKKLDQLLASYSKHDSAIKDQLNPGLSKKEIDQLVSWFPFQVPPEIYALYSWRNGQNSVTETPFSFRDLQFSMLQNSEQYYKSIVAIYSSDEWPVDIEKCFPFAEYEGAFLCLVCDGTQQIVSIFEGVDIYFLSFEKMLDTCIEWANQDGFEFFEDVPNEEEIWIKHNPNLDIHSEHNHEQGNDSWHIAPSSNRYVKAFLNSEFPKQLTISEWIDDEPSKIDRKYFDFSWTFKDGKTTSLYVAFMTIELYKKSFEGIPPEPGEFCSRELELVLFKHNAPNDPKSHPDWGCWLEAIEVDFIRWAK